MKFLIRVIAFSLLSINGFAQDSTRTSSFTVAAIYGNTANYYGQSTAEKLPYVLSYGAYRLKSGLYISASALKLLNFGGGFSSVDLSGGYGFDLSENLRGNLSYTRSFYEKNSPLLQTANENTASGALNYDLSVFETGLSADYAFGNQNDVFVTFSNSKLIDLGSLFSDKDYISLEPSIDIIGGSNRYYETYTVEKNRKQGLLDPLFPKPKPQTETTTVETTGFDIMSYSFSLPLAYNRANYSLEASYQASLLGEKFAENTNKPRSFFNLSFYYQFK
ncbi:MAG TPA: hypothetical protein VNI52_13865 [Sphingobacteriaceae bacterium]|nr:hypothetical protein [Sphingobacteriaceae bacterium]